MIKDQVLCLRPWKGIYVTLNGDVTFCCYLPRPEAVIGNLARSTMEQVWNSEKAARIRFEMLTKRLPDVCGGCPLYNYASSEEREQVSGGAADKASGK
ncbi:MAG: SPASM domain-containing protein [Candidatus Schekmanbacteria bacterium]|nr:SPASM domain-containing protein [Candidatus Schekmanbacteria bacterium]